MVLILVAPCRLDAGFIFKGGKFYKAEEVATASAQEHYRTAHEAYKAKKWKELMRQSHILKKNFKETPFADEVEFFLGIAYFHLGDCEYANRHLSRYLQQHSATQHFEEAIDYKFQIAKHLQEGAKKHLFGWEDMPQWVPAKEDALKIYDEVVAALPNHHLAAQSLFEKGCLLSEQENYKESIQTFQTLIRRFPKHALSPDSYVHIGEIYLEQCKQEFPDPDFLGLATINLRKFSEDFPKEERIPLVQSYIQSMEEVYADSLYQVGKFYQKTEKKEAAAIYFRRILEQYPSSKVASLSQKRLLTILPTQQASDLAPATELR
jgi:outer membrane protein assembly factor BamD (BamD/ComL family)